MKKLFAVLAVTLLATACFQNSDYQVEEKTNPKPTAADTVGQFDTRVEWTCNVDSDCAGMDIGPCQDAFCSAGQCVAQDVVAGTMCDLAESGDCVHGVCQFEGAAMACVAVTAANGTPCGNIFPACGSAGGCQDGICQDPCDDGNPCTDGTCTETGCVYTNNTASCSDGNLCTKNDVCADGVCGGEKFCDCTKDADCAEFNDGNPCTGIYECKANGSCGIKQSTVVVCDETGFEPCQTNICNPENGDCELAVAEDGAECDDLIECTDGDFCVEGECTGIGAITCEWNCDDEVDEDEDGLMDCDEPECWGIDPCPQPECGDDKCTDLADEDCASCPEDCGECPPECGDGKVQAENDEECDDGEKVNGDGCDEFCKVEPAAANAGDIVITEILKDPEAVLDADGEWFEVYNTTDADIDINAWMLIDEGTDSHRIYADGGVVVPTKGYLVLGINGDSATNGGVTVGYVYGNYNLANQDDEVTLKSGETVVDTVAYDDGVTFPDAKGIALSLNASKTDAVENDTGANWCDAKDEFGGGDLGTPGAANPECPYCGDGECNEDENCGSCAGDCACGAGAECIDNNCVDLTPNGQACGAGEDCASKFCVDGVCCATACDGVCEICDASGNKGTCTPITSDYDPESECGLCAACNGQSGCKMVPTGLDFNNDCSAEAQQTCGFNGTCDGEGACDFYGVDVVSEAEKCNGNTYHPADKCDGNGAVVDSGTADCCPYKCAGSACGVSCSANNQCCAGFACVDNACVANN